MFWDIFRIAVFLFMIGSLIYNVIHKQKYGPISDGLLSLIEDTLIPFMEKLQKEIEPDAIIFASCHKNPFPDMDIKGGTPYDGENVNACFYIKDKELTMMSMENPDLQLHIPFEDIYDVISSPKPPAKNFAGRLLMCIRLNNDSYGCRKIEYFAIPYRSWNKYDKKYKDVIDPTPFINILGENVPII